MELTQLSFSFLIIFSFNHSNANHLNPSFKLLESGSENQSISLINSFYNSNNALKRRCVFGFGNCQQLTDLKEGILIDGTNNTLTDRLSSQNISISDHVIFQLYYSFGQKMRRIQLQLPVRVRPRLHRFLKYLNPIKPTFIFIHGWISNLNSLEFKATMEYITKRQIGNSIGIDWSNLAFTTYNNSVRILPEVAKHVVKFIKLIELKKNISPGNITIVGHSLGAHLAGFIGKSVKIIGRIDGLDPSGPLFSIAPPTNRLNSTDAQFVSVIHTDSFIFGMRDKLGHVDFYPNGGKQPSCTRGQDIVVACSHQKAITYYYRSLFESFNSTACESYRKFKSGECSNKYASMGYPTPTHVRGTFYNDILN